MRAPVIGRELDPSRYLVFPVRKTARSTIARFYSIGQTRNNDIVIRDATVSKSHAYFEHTPDGVGLVLRDSRSRNGTYVNGIRVPLDGTLVQAGDRLRFGHVSQGSKSATSSGSTASSRRSRTTAAGESLASEPTCATRPG
jgi:pSer/pThr/pTyr-binding forkhead associated (FHA) protein